MKRSRKPTNRIMIKANTRSNFYTVEFAILHFSSEWVELTNKRLATIRKIKDICCLYNLSFWHSPLKFYMNPVGENFPQKILPKYEDWAFITLDPDEENTLPAVETSYGAHQFIITKNGIAHYEACGKDTADTFLTEEFNLYKLIDKL